MIIIYIIKYFSLKIFSLVGLSPVLPDVDSSTLQADRLGRTLPRLLGQVSCSNNFAENERGKKCVR